MKQNLEIHNSLELRYDSDIIGHSRWKSFYTVLFMTVISGAFLDLNFNLMQITAFVTYMIAAIYIIFYVNIIALVKNNSLYFMFLFFITISIFWSGDFNSSLIKLVNIIGISLLSIFVASSLKKEDFFKIICLFFIISIFLNILVSIVTPQIGIYETGIWKGVYLHKNWLGTTMLFGSVTLLMGVKKENKLKSILIISVALFIIIQSSSISSLLIFFLILGLVLYIQFFRENKLLLISSMFILIGISIYVGFYLLSNINLFYSLIGRDSSLSGRSDLWPLILEAINHKLLFGYGVGGFWIQHGASEHISKLMGWDVYGSHNGFLELLLNVGVVGLTLFILFYFQMVIRILKGVPKSKPNDKKHIIWMLIMCFLILLVNITENRIIPSNNFYGFFLFLLGVVSLYSSKIKEGEI